MATALLPVASTAADSAEVTLADGASTTIALMGATDSRAKVYITYKAQNGEFIRIGELTPGAGTGAKCIASPGTYRVTRPAGYVCGVSRD